MRIHINIGSNQGDRKAILGRAAALIARELAPARILLSDYVESPAWGYESAHDFLNRGLLVITPYTAAPHAILRATRRIEAQLGHGAAHRNPDGSYRDRTIDIDIIDIDRMVLDTPELVLPHPRMHLREFVVRPLLQLDPDWQHPSGVTLLTRP